MDAEIKDDREIKNNNANQDDTNSPVKKKRKSKPIRKFPCHSINEIVQISTLIKDNNGGNPWNTDHVAMALGIKKGGNAFYYLTAASRDYGFTVGTRDTDVVELTDLGRKLVYAKSQEEVAECIRTAFFNIELFKKVYEYYKGSEPSDNTFFKNALTDTFNIDNSFHDDFIRIYHENTEYMNKSFSPSHNIAITTNPTHNIQSIQKSRSGENKLFVIMPFSEKTGKYSNGFFKEVFKQLIEKSAIEAGYIAETADRDGSDIIHSTIVQAISNANIILTDLTEHNPNVLFELGIAIALKKPVVLIKTESTGQIFDIDNTIRVFSYNQNLWPSTLEKDIPNLAKRIKSVIENIGKEKSYFDTFMGI